MPYDPLERLKNGNIGCLYQLTDKDIDDLIKRIRNHEDRLEIIKGCFSTLIKAKKDCFCFDIICDMPEYEDEAYKMLHKKSGIPLYHITPEMLKNMLNNSPIGKKVLNENFEELIHTLKGDYRRSEMRTEEDDLSEYRYLETIFEYAFSKNDKNLLHDLSRYEDLHIRSLFMEYLIEHYPDRIDEVYDDITKYMTSVIYEPLEQLTFLPKLMNQAPVSRMAVKLLSLDRREDYEKLKEFILKEYKHNDLAAELLHTPLKPHPTLTGALVRDEERHEMQKAIFKKDSDRLFATSANFRFHILFDHSELMRREILDEFSHSMRYFTDEIPSSKWAPEKWTLKAIDSAGLSGLLGEWTEKYMDLSQSKEYGFINRGSTLECYRIGDYVIKLIKKKHSDEDVICPNLFLIAKNFEEIYARDVYGRVTGGLEVQKYFTRSAKELDHKYFGYLNEELEKLGYRMTDSLIGGECGDNTMLLDSYREADCSNPESLPDWFKECPLVIVDRDLVFRKNTLNLTRFVCFSS